MDRYEIQLDRNNVQEIYEYDYSQLTKDSVKKKQPIFLNWCLC